MNTVEKIKTIDIKEHISKFLKKGKTDPKWQWFHSSWEDKTESLLVYSDNSKWYFDFSWRLWGWTIIDFQMNYENLDVEWSIKRLKELYNIKEEEKKEFKKSMKDLEILENFENLKLWWYKNDISNFLQLRWLDFDFIQENQWLIGVIFKDYWFYDNYYCNEQKNWDKAKTVAVFIFPCYDENKKLIWVKLRRKDCKTIRWIKSITIWHSWLIYDEINNDEMIICEWEMDYLILKILWFKNIIWNLWWVQSWTEKVKNLLKNCKKIIVMYDNDWPWIEWTKKLQEEMNRPLYFVNYPKIEWVTKYDINDLFKRGFWKNDFENLINEAKLFDEIEKLNMQILYKDRFFADDTKITYFDTKSFCYITPANLARYLWLKPKELEELRFAKVIPSYDWVCYFDWWKPWYYNLFNKKLLLKPNENPYIDDNIDFLLNNLCNNSQTNREWLEKAILYKYSNINNVLIPAVIFHWPGWSWKWLFINLLSHIFWDENTQIGLTQQHIDSHFSAYQWKKLIVEFKELNCWNTAIWKKNMNKMKTFIMEKTIQVEPKWQDPITTENIAWFIMSSNERNPVILDWQSSWNRRFTIIKTGWYINPIEWKKIENAIKNKTNVESFLAYLFEKYPEVPFLENISALENDDKIRLTIESESAWNLFFTWFNEKFPDVNKITSEERLFLLNEYREYIWDNDYNDPRYKTHNFNSWLDSSIQIKVFKKNWKTVNGYFIEWKKIKWDWFLPIWFIKDIENPWIKEFPF